MSVKIRISCIVIVCLFLLIAALSVAVIFVKYDGAGLSALSDGSGTQEDPYRISSAAQLSNLQTISCGDYAREFTEGKYFVITRDLTTYAYPINSRFGFGGHLDGQGHTLRIKGDGLFYRMVDGATLTNMNIEINMRVTQSSRAGICFFMDNDATISNVNVYGDMVIDTGKLNKNTQKPYIALSPFVVWNDGVITDCTYTGNISMTGKTPTFAPQCFYVGCFSADYPSRYGNGQVIRCTAKANISLNYVQLCKDAEGYYSIGGISASNVIEDCRFEGDISVTVPADCAKVALDCFLLGPQAKNSTFVGNGICDCNGNAAPEYFKLAYYDYGTCTHEGEIRILNAAEK